MYPPDAPPLAVIGTTGATAFNFNLHVEDVGHTLVVGPTGKGKSTLLAFLAAQFRRYAKAQMYVFDAGYSMLPFALAAGGAYYDICAEAGAQLAPLAHLDTPADRAWAAEYIRTLCELRGHAVTPPEQQAITAAIGYLAASAGERSLTALWGTVQDRAIRTVLAHYTQGGAAGHLLDYPADSLTVEAFSVFEMEDLLNGDPSAATAVLLYLFRLIERRLQGRLAGGAGVGDPTLILLDEAWILLDHPVFAQRIRSWLKMLRKLNALVVLSTQSVADITTSSIGAALIESTPTKILLPNESASGAQAIRAFYETELGLNERQIDLIATAVPKREYYLATPVGNRLINLELGPLALAFCGVTSRQDRRAILALVEQHGPHWPVHWLRQRGLPDEASALQQRIEEAACAAT